MKIFVFGYGYVMQRWLSRTQSVEHAAVTTRGASAILWPPRVPTETLMWLAENPAVHEAVARFLQTADVLISSVPPQKNEDPVVRWLEGWGGSLPKHVVYLSSTAVYGDHKGAWVDEDTPTHPSSDRGKDRLAAEEAWQVLTGKKGSTLTRVRIAGIYGPHRSAFDQLRQGRARRLTKPDHVMNRIHVDDLWQLIEKAALSCFEGTLNAADTHPCASADVVLYASQKLGIRPPNEESVATANLSVMQASFFEGSRRIRSKHDKALGLQMAYPSYREGLDAIFQEELLSTS